MTVQRCAVHHPARLALSGGHRIRPRLVLLCWVQEALNRIPVGLVHWLAQRTLKRPLSHCQPVPFLTRTPARFSSCQQCFGLICEVLVPSRTMPGAQSAIPPCAEAPIARAAIAAGLTPPLCNRVDACAALNTANTSKNPFVFVKQQ